MLYVESDCTFTHDGQTYESGGAVVTPAYAIGYLSNDGRAITSWHGETLGKARITATWKTPYSHISSTMHQVEATIDGITYTGRCAGKGMLWRGKAKRTR